MPDGYSVNLRRDRTTGEHLAVIPSTYDQGRGRYYMAVGESDGAWVELDPAYVTTRTRTVPLAEFPEWLKRSVDRRLGYILNVAPRLYG